MVTPSILVVDDEPNSLFGLCQILTDEGYKTIPAKNGMEALEKLKAETADIIVTDEKMPDLSGMELLAEVKKLERPIPVILITAYGSVSMALKALKQESYYFFEKHFVAKIEPFLAILRQILRT